MKNDDFQRYFSGAPWEARVGYCRAIKSLSQDLGPRSAKAPENLARSGSRGDAQHRRRSRDDVQIFRGQALRRERSWDRLKAGGLIFVTGTAPVAEDGSTFAPGDPYHQAKRCFEIIEEALTALGSSIDRVVRTRMFVTDISLWDAFGRAHAEVFGDHPPATTMVEVQSLIAPDMLIEIEADAVP